MANVIRSRISTTLLLVGVLASLPAGRSWAQCLGDCDGSGSVGAGELTKIIAIINYCPCASPSVGGLATGCAALPGGADKQCTNADRSGNGCITAGELTGVIADLLNFPSTGCPPGPTATNTPVTPAAATATPTTPAAINTATPTNTPTNAPPTATPVTPPSATPTTPVPTNTAPPTSTPTTPPATNTPIPTATATITATAAATPTTAGAVCGNGAVDTGETCDNGGTCIGGDNAGTHCTAESDCSGDGICESGSNAYRVCSSPADCPAGQCVHCKVFADATCAANCTTQTDVPFPLVKGLVTNSALVQGTSGAIVKNPVGAFGVPILPLNGSQVLSIGQPRNNLIPVSIKSSKVSLGVINIAGLACACVRAVEAMTCGGTIFEKDGLPSTDCTPNYTQGTCSGNTTQVCNINTDCPAGETCVVNPCVGKKPCAYVHGVGNSGSGFIGVNGLDNINLNAFQDAGGYPEPPPPTPPANTGQPILTMRDACSCSSNSECTPGQTCDGFGRCSCTTSADCLPAPGVPSTTPGGICACPNLSSPCASGTTGVCMYEGCLQNSDCPGTQTCKGGGPGSALIVNTTAIGEVVKPASLPGNTPVSNPCVIPTPYPASTTSPYYPYGPDHHFCMSNGVDDDPWSARGVPQTLPVTTGFATGYVINTNITPLPTPGTPTPGPVFGNNLGPYSIFGAPFNVSHLLTPGIPPMTPTPGVATPTNGPYATGAGLAGAFTAINQTTTNTIVTANVQFSK